MRSTIRLAQLQHLRPWHLAGDRTRYLPRSLNKCCNMQATGRKCWKRRRRRTPHSPSSLNNSNSSKLLMGASIRSSHLRRISTIITIPRRCSNRRRAGNIIISSSRRNSRLWCTVLPRPRSRERMGLRRDITSQVRRRTCLSLLLLHLHSPPPRKTTTRSSSTRLVRARVAMLVAAPTTATQLRVAMSITAVETMGEGVLPLGLRKSRRRRCYILDRAQCSLRSSSTTRMGRLRPVVGVPHRKKLPLHPGLRVRMGMRIPVGERETLGEAAQIKGRSTTLKVMGRRVWAAVRPRRRSGDVDLWARGRFAMRVGWCTQK